ncbi:hypothetical protein DFW101_2266 [Solidesulfovibrio carbinoliphilus subsp. oakridgensis]|uniref:Uncharacterized protein n=1 Tax=Solidesulfovibrio carbinoliphilus subsp. oakridgensis TaxID=694327 RepID=G7QAC0_9BACT|nr:hypothetical protein DFW101_2266 [Solidesulfovibrio carbinoliphilus subsp. oakridgensis]
MNTPFIRSRTFASRPLANLCGSLAVALLFPCSRRLCAATSGAAKEPPSPSPLPSAQG